jgi:hypothetical protein
MSKNILSDSKETFKYAIKKNLFGSFSLPCPEYGYAFEGYDWTRKGYYQALRL